MKRGLALLAALLLLGAALYWGLGERGTAPDREEGSLRVTIPDDVVGAEHPWPTAASPPLHGVQVRLRHPAPAEADTAAGPGPRRLRVLYAGPANEPPALTDGFSLTVALRARATGTPLDTLVHRKIRETRRVGGAVLEPVRRASVRGRPGRRWTQENALGGPADHHLVALDDSTVALISASVVGADTARYERTIDAMRRTLRVVASPRAPSSGRSARPPDSVRVTLALLRDPTGPPDRGCDDVVYVERRVPTRDGRSGDALLETALRTLLAIDADSVAGHRHFLGRTNGTLSLDSARVRAGVARIYLRGRLSGLRGVCDHPRARIQLEETARALPNVDRVALYRNGRRTDLTPGGRGTPGPPETPNTGPS